MFAEKITGNHAFLHIRWLIFDAANAVILQIALQIFAYSGVIFRQFFLLNLCRYGFDIILKKPVRCYQLGDVRKKNS
jgi:hypothetical protein